MLKKINYIRKTGFHLALCYSHFHLLEFSIKSNPFLLLSHLPPCKHTSHKPSFLHFASTEINSTANTFLFSIDAIQLVHRGIRSGHLIYLDKIQSLRFVFFSPIFFVQYIFCLITPLAAQAE